MAVIIWHKFSSYINHIFGVIRNGIQFESLQNSETNLLRYFKRLSIIYWMILSAYLNIVTNIILSNHRKWIIINSQEVYAIFKSYSIIGI